MSIGVQSYPELYTMLIGWNLYDQMWSLLSSTGLAFLPFIGIFIKKFALPYMSQEPRSISDTSLRRVEIDLITKLLIAFFCVAPCYPIDPTVVSYTPICSTNSNNLQTYHPGSTNTTWDKAFTVPTQTVYVPLWWMGVMAVSEGFTSAGESMVGCVPNLRKMVTEVNMAQIKSPELKQELQNFEQDCYVPARTQYFQDEKNNNTSNLSIINQDRKTYGVGDTEWFGSHAFQDTYYQNLSAQEPVQGFTYNPSEDINANADKTNPPAYGTPTCADWWNDSQNGLQNRLYKALPKDFSTQFASFFSNDSNGVLKDNVIKQLINHSSSGYHKATNMIGNDGYSHAIEAVGTWTSQFSTYPKIYAAEQTAPIIQALLLLLVYTFLPFALVFSGYKPTSVITGSIVIFSLIFWSFIWHLVTYIDSTLMSALYTNDSWFSMQTPSATLADMTTGILIIVAPLFWFSFMSAMGVAVVDVVSGAFSGMSGVGNQAAQEGAALTKSAASAIPVAKGFNAIKKIL